MAKTNNHSGSTRRSTFPRSIQNMIQRAYLRGENSRQAAERINDTRLAQRLGLDLTQHQVAAAYAWITMRETK